MCFTIAAMTLSRAGGAGRHHACQPVDPQDREGARHALLDARCDLHGARIASRAISFVSRRTKGGRLEPAFRAIPIGGLRKSLFGGDLGPPDVFRRRAGRADDPVGMAEIGGSVGRELGLVAAHQAVERGAEAKQRARGGQRHGARPTARPSADANSRWVQPPGLPSSGSITSFFGHRLSASASSSRARSST